MISYANKGVQCALGWFEKSIFGKCNLQQVEKWSHLSAIEKKRTHGRFAAEEASALTLRRWSIPLQGEASRRVA